MTLDLHHTDEEKINLKIWEKEKEAKKLYSTQVEAISWSYNFETKIKYSLPH